jgi:hypothetical protein
MKRGAWLLLLLVLGAVGLLACGQVPVSPLPGAVDPTPGPSPLPGLPLAPLAAPPTGTVVLQEDFAGPLAATWSVLDIAETPGQKAVWYSDQGVLVQGGTDTGMGAVDSAYMIVDPQAAWTDYIVRANLYVDTNDEAGLIFRVNDAGFYRFRMRSAEFEGPYQVGLDRYQDRRYTVLWHAPGHGFPPRQWITVQIVVRGDTFTVSVDGEVIATVQDSTFAQGGVGFYAWAEGGAYFDNLVVTR